MLVLLPVARLLAVNVSVLLLQTIFCLFAACRLVYLHFLTACLLTSCLLPFCLKLVCLHLLDAFSPRQSLLLSFLSLYYLPVCRCP
jgi:hypothetical protein